MTGLRRPIPSKFLALAMMGAFAVSLNSPVQAEQRSGAPIKFMGQGGSTTSSASKYSQTDAARTSYAHTAIPAYAGRVNRTSEPENPRTKRIEFRYPDQPSVSHGSDGVTRQGQGTPIKYSSQQSAIAAQSVRQVASVGQPAPSISAAPNAPILHQPDYERPTIDETPMADIVSVAVPEPVVFTPVAQPRFDATGLASWYGEAYHGQPTANGELFDMEALTAAHPTLPLPSLVQVKNLENGREVVVRVNDRGPFVPDHIIDLSKRAADELGFLVTGEAKVSIRFLGPAPVASEAAGQGTKLTAQPQSAAPAAAAPNTFRKPRKMDPIPNPTGPAYFIQAGSFSEISNAQRLSTDLGGTLPVDVAMATVNGSDYFRVLIGPYRSRSEASTMRDQLAENGIVNGVLITSQK